MSIFSIFIRPVKEKKKINNNNKTVLNQILKVDLDTSKVEEKLTFFDENLITLSI